MKYTKIICIILAIIFIVTAANSAVARQETRSLKIKDILKSGFLKSEGRLDGEGPLARIISLLLGLFNRGEIVNVEDPPVDNPEEEDPEEEDPEEEDPEEEEPVEENGVVRGNVSVVLEGSSVSLSDASVDFYLPGVLDEAVHSTLTKGDGSYIVNNVEDGVYTIRASKEGYETKTCEVKIDSGHVENVDFVLNKEETVELDLDFGIQDVQVDEQIYDNSVSAMFSIKNNGEDSVTISSLDLGGSLSVKITRPDSKILWYGISDDSDSSSMILDPGETHNKVIEIKDEEDTFSRKGIYELQGFYKSTEEPDIELSTTESQFEIKTDKYAINIINEFSLRLFKEFLPDEDVATDSIIIKTIMETSFSPMLLWLGLHMLQKGAAGNNYDEITNILGIDGNDENVLNDIKNTYDRYLNPKSNTEGVTINNAIWIDEDQKDIISQNYINTLKEEYNYDASFLNLNGFLRPIGDWVQDTTNGIFSGNLFPPKALDPLFISSAFYLKGEWEKPFDSTIKKDFYFEDKQEVLEDQSFITGTFENLNYEETEDLQILDLPCNGDISMLMMLPKQGYKIEDIAKYINKETLSEWQESFTTNAWSDSTFDVCIPKTKVYTPPEKREIHPLETMSQDGPGVKIGIPSEAIIQLDMTDNLKEMGMTQAFSKQNADFSKIKDSTSKVKNLYLKNVVQDSFIKINESGIEAAALTGASMIDEEIKFDSDSLEETISLSSDNRDNNNPDVYQNENMENQDSPDTIVFDADHPFSFIIHDKQGTILYMGTVYGKIIVVSPLVLDLKGDGIKTSELSDGVMFDLNNDGKKDLTGWTAGKDDAFLALDLNHNGIIDNGGELFGDNTLINNGRKAQNGFEALAQYDTNKDLKIDQKDKTWADLLLWIDTNHNGISEQKELTPIKDSQVHEIYLDYSYLNKVDHGNLLRECSSFRNKDGTLGSIIDIWFKVIM